MRCDFSIALRCMPSPSSFSLRFPASATRRCSTRSTLLSQIRCRGALVGRWGKGRAYITVADQVRYFSEGRCLFFSDIFALHLSSPPIVQRSSSSAGPRPARDEHALGVRRRHAEPLPARAVQCVGRWEGEGEYMHAHSPHRPSSSSSSPPLCRRLQRRGARVLLRRRPRRRPGASEDGRGGEGLLAASGCVRGREEGRHY